MKVKIFGVAWYWYLAILVIVLVILLVLFRTLKRGSTSKAKKDTDYAKSLEKLRRIIKRVNPELDNDTQLMIMAQALFETGGLGYEVESPVLERNNNLFGMKSAHVRNRDQLGDLDNDGYANYKDWEQSVRDHRLWLEANGMFHSYLVPVSFVEDLKKKRYFEANLFVYKRGLLFYYDGLKTVEDKL